MADPIPGTPASASIAGAVAPGSLPNPPAIVAPAVPAAQTAPQYGGLRGGRARKDGLLPGTKEAIEADREKDRVRKARQRVAADPAALPGAVGSVHALAAIPGAGDGVPGIAVVPVVPWDPKSLQPISDQLISTAEDLSVRTLIEKATKAKLPGEIIKDIEKDARWAPVAKKALEVSTPQIAAKWLNKSGLSSEWQPELTWLTAVSAISAGQTKLLKRLDELIRAANPPGEEKAK